MWIVLPIVYLMRAEGKKADVSAQKPSKIGKLIGLIHLIE